MKRRSFIKISCCLGAGLALTGLGLNLAPITAWARDMEKINAVKQAKQTTTICCYCSVGCGLICSTDTTTDKIINIEGDPEHPINEGSLCAKGASFFQLSEANQHRLTKVQYRAPGTSEWVEKDWDFALDRISELIKRDRDAAYVEKNAKGEIVNRVENISLMGSSNILNEECWVTAQFARSLGLVWLDHQARV